MVTFFKSTSNIPTIFTCCLLASDSDLPSLQTIVGSKVWLSIYQGKLGGKLRNKFFEYVKKLMSEEKFHSQLHLQLYNSLKMFAAKFHRE